MATTQKFMEEEQRLASENLEKTDSKISPVFQPGFNYQLGYTPNASSPFLGLCGISSLQTLNFGDANLFSGLQRLQQGAFPSFVPNMFMRPVYQESYPAAPGNREVSFQFVPFPPNYRMRSTHEATSPTFQFPVSSQPSSISVPQTQSLPPRRSNEVNSNSLSPTDQPNPAKSRTPTPLIEKTKKSSRKRLDTDDEEKAKKHVKKHKIIEDVEEDDGEDSADSEDRCGERRLAIEFESYGAIGVRPQTIGNRKAFIPDGLIGRFNKYSEKWRFEIRHGTDTFLCKDGIRRVCITWSIQNVESGKSVVATETQQEAFERNKIGRTVCNRVFRDAVSLRKKDYEALLIQEQAKEKPNRCRLFEDAHR